MTELLVQKLRQARRIAVLTGSGISKESGLSTFRDEDGHWAKVRPQDLATLDAFQRDPELVQSWYAGRMREMVNAEPNPAHYALAAIEEASDGFTLITQNIDDLHRIAGNRNILELHGNIKVNYCVDCRQTPAMALDKVEHFPHRCAECGGLIRPGVVWFGEQLPDGAIEQAFAATSRCDVFLSVGTSGLVSPASWLPEFANEAGAYTVEINVEPTALTPIMDEVLIGKAGEILPTLVENAFAAS